MKTQNILSLLLCIALLTGCDHPVATPLTNDLPNPVPTSTPEPPPSPTDPPTEVSNDTDDGNVVAPDNLQSLNHLYTLSDDAIVYNAFDAENPTSSPIMLINLTTGFSGPIPNTIDGWAPDLSPIEQRVVFIKHNSDKDWPIYVVNVDGSNLQQLTSNHLDHFPAWSPDGKQLVFSRDGNLWVMDVSTDAGSDINLVQLTSDPKEVVTAPRWSPDGQKIVYSSQIGNPLGTASYEDPNSVEIYMINSDGSELTRLTQNTAVDGFADWSPDGTMLVFSSNRDGKFAIYTMLPDGSEVKRLTELDSNNINPIWALDGQQIIFSSDRDDDEYTYQLYTMNAEGIEIKRLSISDTSDFNPSWADLSTGMGPVYSQAWSADGKILVTADYDQIRMWDAVTFREAGVLEGHTDFVWGLAWSPTSNPLILASASQDGSVRLWNMATFTQTDLLETGWAYCVAWSPNGRQLAVGNDGGDVQLWDVATREMLETWSSNVNDARDDIISIAWSPDGQTVAFGDLAGNINLWDVATSQARMVLTEQTTDHARDVNGLAWSPDSALLASTHPDGQVQIWDTVTGQLVQVIAAHTGWARGIAFSPDGRLLASTGEDKRICLWDVATGQEYAEQQHNRLPAWSVSWSPDSEYVVSGGGVYEQPHIGETIIWKVP